MIFAKSIWLKVDSKVYSKQKIEKLQNELNKLFSKIWSVVFMPVLFMLIGNEVNFTGLNMNTIGLGFACICISLIFRCLATYLSVSWNDFNLKEKMFILVSWIPKATVQAAVGSIALDLAKQQANNKEEINLATTVLNIAVLSIVVTAPLGTILISKLAPKLLTKTTTTTTTTI
jgi:solute carrier family 9B (sodium/hydrogen exchanger), member 1/2